MPGTPDQTPSPYCATPIAELLSSLHSSENGLSSAAAADCQSNQASKASFNPTRNWLRAAWILAAQFKSPITLILIGAALLSLFLRDLTDASIILVIVIAGALLSFWQEYTAANAVAALLALVGTKVTVLRDGREVELP
jgi:Mg2+-importing ATPase